MQASGSNTVSTGKVLPNPVIEADDGIVMDNSTSNKEDTDVEDDSSVNYVGILYLTISVILISVLKNLISHFTKLLKTRLCCI